MVFKIFGGLVSERYDSSIGCEIIQKKLFIVTARRGVQLQGGSRPQQVSDEGLPSLGRPGGAGRLLRNPSRWVLQPLGQRSCSKGDVRDLSHRPSRCLGAMKSAGAELHSPWVFLLKYLETKKYLQSTQNVPI